MPAAWLRLHRSLLNSHKVQSLDPILFKAWVNLLCLANDEGVLPNIDEISFALRVSVPVCKKRINELIMVRLVDAYEASLVMHDWNAHQFLSDSSTGRVRAFRERRRNVSVTSPEAETENRTEAETEQKERTPRVRAVGRDEFELDFWPRYPNKVGKPKARAAFGTARKKHTLSTILTGLDRYKQDKPPDRQWMNPATFLNQERFNDQPGKVEEPKSFRKPDPTVYVMPPPEPDADASMRRVADEMFVDGFLNLHGEELQRRKQEWIAEKRGRMQ